MDEQAKKSDDEFTVNVRTDAPAEQKSDEELFDQAVGANDEQPGAQLSHQVTEATSAQPDVPVAPASQPEAAATAAGADASQKPKGNTAGILVLQWVTYAFWGWFALAILWLSALTFGYFVTGNDSQSWGDALAYPLASVVVMLIIAQVADLFYVKHEPERKTGGSSVIMLIHAVLFVLLTVASLIVAVFSLINMSINSDPVSGTNGPAITLFTALIMLSLYGLASARVLFGGRKKILRTVFWAVSVAMALIFTIASVAGPAARANATKDDRLIESALPELATDIQNYTRENDKLPASLSDVKSTSSYSKEKVQLLISKKLVEYKPNSQDATTNDGGTSYPSSTSMSGSTTIKYAEWDTYKTFYYQLCVDYKAEKSPDYYYKSTASSGDRYSNYADTSSHKAGKVCYRLEASGKYSDYDGVKPL